MPGLTTHIPWVLSALISGCLVTVSSGRSSGGSGSSEKEHNSPESVALARVHVEQAIARSSTHTITQRVPRSTRPLEP